MNTQVYEEIKKVAGLPDLILCKANMYSFLKEQGYIQERKDKPPLFDGVRVVITDQVKEDKIMLFYNDKNKDNYTINLNK